MENEHGGVVVKGRAIIDTRPPFRSVKEAVALFGERVLVGEIYAKQLKEIQQVPKTDSKKENASNSTKGVVSADLEETKQNLQKAREEGNYMANCLKSLKEQLEETKKELRNLKAEKDVVKDHHQHTKAINLEIEELKFVEINDNNANNFDDNRGFNDRYYQQEYQKKKVVTFASPPSLTREIKKSLNTVDDERTSKLGRSSSFRKEGKKKPVVAIMGWFFSRKKRSHEGDLDGLDRSPQV